LEGPQGNSLCTYLKQTKIYSFSFFFFSYTKSDNRRAEQVLPGGGLVSVGEGRRWENDERG
jgi:hypothetical protein